MSRDNLAGIKGIGGGIEMSKAKKATDARGLVVE